MTTDTRVALDAAIDKFARAAIDDANALGAPDEFAAAKAAWAAIAPAITAHVEAEVTRRLAAAAGSAQLASVEVELDSLRPHLTGGATLNYLRAAIAIAIAEAREAGRREVIGAAPSVEEAIATVWRDCDHGARCNKEIADDDHSQGRRGSPGDQDDCDCAVAGHFATLRAAIAADRDRAVRYATAHMRPMVSREQAAQLVARFEESIGHELRRRIDGDRKDLIDALTGGDASARITSPTGVVPVVADASGRMLGGRREGRDTVYDQIKVHVARDKARPTPDEARRLVGEYAAAHGALVLLMHGGQYDPHDDEGTRRAAAESTRDTLLRALGVEA